MGLKRFSADTEYLKPPTSFFDKVKLYYTSSTLALGNVILFLFSRLIFNKRRKVKKILVFRTGSVGDSVCAIASIKSINRNYPEAVLDILTNLKGKQGIGLDALLDSNSYNKIIDYNNYSLFKLITVLRAEKYHLVIQLPQFDASFLRMLRDMFVLRSVAASGFGWRVSQHKWFRHAQASYLQFYNERKRLHKILLNEGIKSENYTAHLVPSSENIHKAEEILLSLGIKKQENLIALVIGSNRPQNRWPIWYFKEVIDYFSKEYKFLIIGGSDDAKLASALLDNAIVYNACGLLNLQQSAAALKRCVLTLSNDTGPMHLSYAVGTYTIALFSSRDLPGKWYPPVEKSTVFRSEGWCGVACFKDKCIDNTCMKSIQPSCIIKAMESFFASRIISSQTMC
jgi:ADP-heptose:LPS heptosyltransferase